MNCGTQPNGGVYVLDVLRGRWEGYELEREAIDFWQKHKFAKPSYMMIEDKASGTGLIQSLKRQQNIPVRATSPTKDKFTRVIEVQGYFESGYVSVPEKAVWVSDFVVEL